VWGSYTECDPADLVKNFSGLAPLIQGTLQP